MSLKGIHINADLGEDYGRYTIADLDEMMPYLTACNVACGFHAGDPSTIDATLLKAKRHSLQIGAHPSYPDLQGFGRRSMSIPTDELTSILRYQICALAGMAKSIGIQLSHVKPHGALYNDAARDIHVARAVCNAIRSLSDEIPLYVPPGSVIFELATEEEIPIMLEAFLDRTYEDDLSLTPRSHTGSVINDPSKAHQQASSIYQDNKVITTTGKEKSMSADTFCIHGDNPAALEILKAIHA